MNITAHRLPLVALLLALAACGRSAPPPAAASKASPADPALAALYESSCRDCHTAPGSGAPQAGDAAAWAPRLAQGKDSLLDHTINGYLGMPPMGMCMSCSEDDFASLIAFMSGSELQ